MSETVLKFCGEPMTKRDVLLAREAAAHALHGQTAYARAHCDKIAARLFPLPVVARPRVVTDKRGRQWKMDGDALKTRGAGSDTVWVHAEDAREEFWFTPDRIRMWADLLANPTETVEDGE